MSGPQWVFVLLVGLAIIIFQHLDPPDGNKSAGWDLTTHVT